MHVDVLCVGRASYDLVFTVDRHPGEDEKCVASGLVTAGGGPAANAAITVARLGGTAAFAGYLGNDTFGELHADEFRAEGVVTDLTVRGRHPTPLSAIFVKPGGKRTVITNQGNTPALASDAVDFSRIEAKTLLFDGHEPDLSIPLARSARSAAVPTVLDAGSVHRGTTELAPLCGYLVASEKFARDYSGEKAPGKALDFLAGVAPVAVITLGEAGLIWASRSCSGAIPAFAVEAVDTTGAGDAFHGALAYRLALGESLTDALRYSSAVAAMKCLCPGARQGIPRKGDVDKFLEERSR